MQLRVRGTTTASEGAARLDTGINHAIGHFNFQPRAQRALEHLDPISPSREPPMRFDQGTHGVFIVRGHQGKAVWTDRRLPLSSLGQQVLLRSRVPDPVFEEEALHPQQTESGIGTGGQCVAAFQEFRPAFHAVLLHPAIDHLPRITELALIQQQSVFDPEMFDEVGPG